MTDLTKETEVCEWVEIYGYYKWGCRPDLEPLPMPMGGRYCPFCGKPIHISEGGGDD